ncbi:MAG: hypothetical protein Q7T16_03725, partial [Candidatus Burarchaeum sp.]
SYRLNEILGSFTLPIWLLALIGLGVVASRRRKPEDVFLVTWLAVPLLLYFTYVFHEYYVVSLAAPMAILAAGGMEKAASFVKPASRPIALSGLMLVFLAVELYLLAAASSGPSADQQLMDFASQLPHDAVMLTDPKIHYTTFGQVFAQQEVRALPYLALLQLYSQGDNPAIWGNGALNLATYTVSCESSICGWDESLAEIKDVTAFWEQTRQLPAENVKDIYEGGELVYRVYALDTSIAIPAHELKLTFFFGQSLGEPKEAIDFYEIRGWFDDVLNRVGHLAVYVDVLLALSVPILGVYVLFKEKD